MEHRQIPKDAYQLSYIIYFTLGAGFLLPFNTFINAVDYFTYLYPDARIDRIFASVYMGFALLFLMITLAKKSKFCNASVRINLGMGIFIFGLLVVPTMEVVYIKGQTGLYSTFYATVAAVGLSGVADALVQGGVVGSASGLPKQYMQAVVSGTAASGLLVSILRMFTKAVFSQDPNGLRRSTMLYFSVSIILMTICTVLYNVAQRIPVIKYYRTQPVNQEMSVAEGGITHILWRVKWYGFGILLIYVVTFSIFPGYITEDMHSQVFKDWYPIFLITGYNLFDLVGKSLTALCLLRNAKVAICACVARFVFYPLFYLCVHGLKFFRTEIPVALLTCLLGVSNGYLTSVLMILAPKVVNSRHAETAGMVMVMFLIVGLAIGSIIAWFWVI